MRNNGQDRMSQTLGPGDFSVAKPKKFVKIQSNNLLEKSSIKSSAFNSTFSNMKELAPKTPQELESRPFSKQGMKESINMSDEKMSKYYHQGYSEEMKRILDKILLIKTQQQMSQT